MTTQALTSTLSQVVVVNPKPNKTRALLSSGLSDRLPLGPENPILAERWISV
jgi:hypothetical protein